MRTLSTIGRQTLTWLALIGCCVLSATQAGAEDYARRRVLYLGIDGCRFDAIGVADTPNLDRLMAEGCYSNTTLILGERYQKNDTISGPGWSSILTGVWADKHGVHDNSFQGKNYEDFPHIFARLKEVRPEAFTASVVDWIPIQTNIVSGADIGTISPPINNDYVPADAEGAKMISKILTEKDPTFVFYYIGQVDETGHKYGFHPTVKEYIEAIERADQHVGEVLAAMESRKTFEDEEWLVLVTSDHGGKGLGHGGGHQEPEILNSFSIVSGAGAKRGKIEEQVYLVDVPYTALEWLAGEPKAEWKLDGKAIGLK